MYIRLISVGMVLSAALFTFTSYAQNDTAQAETPWKFGGLFSLTAAQVSLINWQAGGENSISGNGLLKVTADYKKGKFSWNSYLEAGIGATQLGDDDIQKTDDRIELGTKVGHDLSERWNLNAFMTFRTQFTEGFELQGDTLQTRISHIMAPGYVLAGIGFEYKPTSWFSANVSPSTGKFTFVTDQDLADDGAFGVDPAEFNAAGVQTKEGSQFRAEIGGYLKIEAKKEVVKNVTIETKADFFSNYLENPENIDINWDLIVIMKVNDYLSANLTTNLIYDDDINIATGTNEQGASTFGPRVQFKQVFGAGLTIKM